MIQTLAMGVQNSTATATAPTSEVASMGEEVKKEVATMGGDVKKIATKVDTIEEEVCATKKLLEKTQTQEWKGWRGRYRNMPRNYSKWRRSWQKLMLEQGRQKV